jgi:hypothetical protein
MAVYRPEERRLVLRLMAYWDDLRNEREYPPVGEIDPETIGDDWPNCFLLKLDEPVSASRLQAIGENLLGGHVLEPGTQVADCPGDTLLYQALKPLSRMLDKRIPMSIGGEAEVGGTPTLYRSILLPLSDDGATIDHVLGAANGKPADGSA